MVFHFPNNRTNFLLLLVCSNGKTEDANETPILSFTRHTASRRIKVSRVKDTENINHVQLIE